MSSQTYTLDRIARGRRARVLDVAGGLDADPIARRLDDLGIRAGVEIRMVRRAPFGDPTVFELHGYQLCLRRSESARVRVSLDVAGDTPGLPVDHASAERPGEPSS